MRRHWTLIRFMTSGKILLPIFVYSALRSVDRCIDLRRLDKWRRLRNFPERLKFLALHANAAFVYNDYAWFFTGHKDVLRFNMNTETWDYVSIKMSEGKKQKWPYKDKGLVNPSITLAGHHLYIFGGDIKFGKEGTDSFMVIDLDSLQWRFLGDSSLYKNADYPGKYWPPPRCGAGCWFAPHEKRIYLLFGTSEQQDRYNNPAENPEYDPYYSDLWSYSIKKETWERERVRGNPPCPREDMAIT